MMAWLWLAVVLSQSVFSTFDDAPSDVFEDFYICPKYRHEGIARELVQYAYFKSGICLITGRGHSLIIVMTLEEILTVVSLSFVMI